MKRRLTIMKQNEKSFVMTDAAVSANTNNMEDKGMKGKFKNYLNRFSSVPFALFTEHLSSFMAVFL